MKKILSTAVAILAFIQFSYAQWTYATSPFNKATYSGSVEALGGNFTLDNTYWYSVKNTSGVTSPLLGANGNALYVGDLFGNFNGGLGIRTNGADRIVITNTGTVGINTSNHNSYLSVTSGTTIPAAYFTGGWGGANPVVKIDVSGGLSSPSLDLVGTTSTYPSIIRSLYSMQFATQNNGNILLNPTGTGSVGIGTVPTDATYKLSVNGSIRSKEVKVLATWSDYVFDTDYKLKTIPEVEAFIKQNHHLPDVPSAAEVEKNGVALGETSSLLLRKVEELTLYLIEKDKQVRDQSQQLKDQQKQLDELKAQMIKLIK